MGEGTGKAVSKRAAGTRRVRAFGRRLRGAMWATYQDGGLGTAKSAAYSALLCFFPLLATVATVLVHVRASYVSHVLSVFLSEILPPGTHDLAFYYFTVRGQQPFLIPFTSALVSIWAGSGVIISLMEGFRAAYRIPNGRPFVQQRLVALGLEVGAALPATVASLMVLFGARVEQWTMHALGLLPAGAELGGWIRVAGTSLRYLTALGAISTATAILYRYGPNRPQKWRGVWPGALVTTALWLIATLLFAWYVRHIANYNVVYGGVAAVILLLVWMYVLAVIAFIGCEFNVQYERDDQ